MTAHPRPHMHRTVTDPYLNLFRGIIPPIGGTLDLSPILAFVTLNVSSALLWPALVACTLPPLRFVTKPLRDA